MKKVIFIGLASLFLGLQNVAEASTMNQSESEAYVHNVIVGEFDPIYVGDACLVELVRSENEAVVNKIALLMTDADCIDHKDQLFIGQKVSLQLMRGESVTDKNVLNVLKQISDASHFIYSQF